MTDNKIFPYLIRNFPNPFILISLDGSVNFINSAFEKLTGFSWTEVVGIKPPYPWWTNESKSKILHDLDTALSSESIRLEEVFQNKAKEKFWVEISMKLIRIKGQEPFYLSSWYNVTDWKKREAFEWKKQKPFYSLLQNLSDIIIVLNADMTVKYISPSLERVLGYKPEPYIGQNPMLEFIHPSDISNVYLNFEEVSKKPGVSEPIEVRVRHENGSWLYLEVIPNNCFNDPDISGIVLNIRDITERKKLRLKYKESEERLRNFVVTIPAGIVLTDEKGVMIEMSENYAKLYGYSREEMLGQNFMEHILKFDSRDKAEKVFKILHDIGNVPSHEIMLYDKFGKERPVELAIETLRNNENTITNFVIVVYDISQRKKVEKNLKYHVKQLTLIADISSHFINIKPHKIDYHLDYSLELVGKFMEAEHCFLFTLSENKRVIDGIFEWTKPGFNPLRKNLKLYAIPPDSWWLKRLSGFECIQISDNSDYESLTFFEKDVLKLSNIKSILIVPLIWLGELIGFWGVDVVNKKRVFVDEDIQFLKTLGNIFANAFEYRKSSEALVTSEEFRSTLFNISPNPIIVLNQDKSVIYVNSAFERLTGFMYYEAIGKTPPFPWWSEEMTDMNNNKEPLVFEKYKSEMVYKKKSGEKIWVETTESTLKNSNEIVYYFSTWVDITHRKKAEDALRYAFNELKDTQEELIKSEKLAVIGKFSSGIAHEIRNPLGNISASAQYVIDKYDLDQDVKNYLEIILRNSERANHIISNLFGFTKTRTVNLKEDSIDNVINNTCNLVRARSLSQEIEIIVKNSKNIPQFLFDEKLLEEAFLNIIINAFDAMPDGGILYIKTIYNKKKNEVKIHFTDTGMGIPKDVTADVFEPFFTTKTNGVGLGLCLVEQVVDFHKGKINLKSILGKGTEITIELPILRTSNKL